MENEYNTIMPAWRYQTLIYSILIMRTYVTLLDTLVALHACLTNCIFLAVQSQPKPFPHTSASALLFLNRISHKNENGLIGNIDGKSVVYFLTLLLFRPILEFFFWRSQEWYVKPIADYQAMWGDTFPSIQILKQL